MSSRKDGTMNFADQLRQTSLGAYQAEALRIHMETLKETADIYAKAVRPGCSRAAERGLNHVKGYIYKYDSSISENGPEYYFSETLPSVEEYQNKIDYYKSVFSSNVYGVVNGEISLYSPRYNGQDWVITQNPDDAKILRDMLKTILTDDGFSTVSVKVLEKPQTFVKIAKTWKPGSFMGRALRGQELSMTTRTTDKKEYILEIEVKW